MNHTFLISLFNMSLTASYLVIGVLLARLLLKKAPRWITCALWGLVAFRLVCPFTIETVLSIIPKADPIPTDILYETTPAIDSGIPAVNQIVNPFLSQTFAPYVEDSVNPLQMVFFVGAILWIVGMSCILFYAAIGYLRLSRRLYERVPLQDNIYLCDKIDTPFILGIIKPRIFLPSNLDQTTMDCVIAHEQAHIQRKDHLWKPFAFLLLTVYWFNPLLWLAYSLFCKDLETACDQKVVASMDKEEIKTYACALLSCSTSHKNLGVAPLAFGETNIKTRIKSILHYKKPTLWIMIAAIVVAIALVLCLLTNPIPTASAVPPTPPDSLPQGESAGEETTPLDYDAIEYIVNETTPVIFRTGTELFEQGVLDISHIASVNPYENEDKNEQNQNAWLITLTPQGTKQFAKATRENIGNRITIWLCNTHTYSPMVLMEITDGRLLVTPNEEDPDFFVNLAWLAQQWNGDAASDYEAPLENQYEMVALLHQTGDNFRDPGDLQPETEEMIRLDDGQYYQTYADYQKNERYVFTTYEEFGIDLSAWEFIPIGTVNEYSAQKIAAYKNQKQSQDQKEYAQLLAQKRKGYQWLVQAPPNPQTPTKHLIEEIFYVDLPENYQVTDYQYAPPQGDDYSPGYAITILMEEEDLHRILSSYKMEIYQEMPVNKSVVVEPSDLSQWFVDYEHMNYLTEEGIVTVHHMDSVEMYIMKEPVNGKREVFFRFMYYEE